VTARDARAREQLHKWREELINLSRTNRLLYYRPTKSSTLEILAPDPGAILRRLVGPGGSWRFFEPPDPTSEDPPIRKAKEWISARGTSELLTQKTDKGSLESAFRLLDRRATQEFVDRGLSVLYLAAGFLEWVDPESEERGSAPLLLVPVQLFRENPRVPYELRRADDDVRVNEALAVRLQRLGIVLPEIDADIFEDGALDAVLAAVDLATREQPDWEVTDKVVLGIFSFQKEVMYRDLLENEERVLANAAVRGLALGPEADVDLSFDPIPEERLDEEAPPEEMVSIRDADATQRQCIAAAREGRSFVMDGPPGTGKSQTIANIIAELISAQKTVLFVSEKAAALDVVSSRLKEAGLGEFLLELHSHKATRKEVALELGRALSTRPVAGRQMSRATINQLVADRRELSAYAAAMNAIQSPLDMSLHQAIGEVSRLHELPQAPVATRVGADLDAQTFAELADLAGVLARSWGPVSRGEDFHWRGTVIDSWGGGTRYELLEAVDQAIDSLDALHREAQLLAEELTLATPTTPSDTGAFAELVSLIRSRPSQVPAQWLTGTDLDEVRSAIAALAALTQQHDEAIDELQTLVGEGWMQLESSGQFEEALTGFTGSSYGWELDATTTAERIDAIAGSLQRTVTGLPGLQARLRELAEAFGVSIDDASFERATAVARLVALADAPNPPATSWLTSSDVSTVEQDAAMLRPLVEEFSSLEQALGKLFTRSVLKLPLAELKTRFLTQHHGFGKLSSQYRADRQTLRAVSPNGKFRKDMVDGLEQAIAWQRVSQGLTAFAEHHPAVGDSQYFRGPDTDLHALDTAVSVARQAMTLAGRTPDRVTLASQLGDVGHRDARMAEAGRQLLLQLNDWHDDMWEILGDPSMDLFDHPLVEVHAWARDAHRALSALIDAIRTATSIAGREADLGTTRAAAAARAREAMAERSLEESGPIRRQLLGEVDSGFATDTTVLAGGLRWCDDVLTQLAQPVDEAMAQLLIHTASDPGRLFESYAAWNKRRDAITSLFEHDRANEVRADLDVPFPDVDGLLRDLKRNIDDIEEWIVYREVTTSLAERGLDAVIAFCVDRQIAADAVPGIVRRSLLEGWIDSRLVEINGSGKTRARDRDELAASFRELDRAFIGAASARAIEACASRRPNTALGEAGRIKREAEKRTRHMPVRRLLAETKATSMALKPVFMMSPLTVSQFLPSDMRFDCVIFDEASQVKPADAINSIYRGGQLIIAGDQRQLPPSSFFERLEDEDDEYVDEQLDSFESVLDLAKAAGWMKDLPLLWHYRSQHEGLITFSNYRFYDGRLVTFPSKLQEGADLGIELFLVPGVYRRGGARDNQVEAEQVLDRVLFHAQNHPDLTLGVVTFSEAQAACIEYAIERERRLRPDLDQYFGADRMDGFFVKALEAVQGDERDIVIFSIGYGPDEIGKFTQNFGPLNRDGGWRRLNVAVTRARRRVELVSSIRDQDFSQFDHIPSRGVQELRRYLSYAEMGIAAVAPDLEDSRGDAESPFEEEVLRVINGWGYEAVPQVGHAGYRIDIGVRHPERRGDFILGIECDGAMYHSSKVARDRDRLRQEVLERLGWRIHRIWGTAWYGSRAHEETRLRETIEAALAGKSRVPPPSPAVAGNGQGVQVIDLQAPPPWARLYGVTDLEVQRRYRRLAMHQPEAMPELKRLIADVVEIEAPVHVEVALTRIREAWGAGRAGARIREAFETALRSLAASKAIRISNDFIHSASPRTVAVRVPDPDLPESFRTVAQIPHEELDAAIVMAVREARSVVEDELTKHVAGMFGWARRGPEISSAMEKSVRRLLRRGALARSGESLLEGGPESSP
jgi:hypothetical protein